MVGFFLPLSFLILPESVIFPSLIEGSDGPNLTRILCANPAHAFRMLGWGAGLLHPVQPQHIVPAYPVESRL